jgi:hypothetical protein
MLTPRRRAPDAATSRSRPHVSPASRARARGLVQKTPSISPSWGRNYRQQGPPPPRGPRRTGTQNEHANTLGEGHGGLAPARSPPPPLPAAALWAQS